MKTIPKDKWKWYGKAGHLCVAAWCRFHLTTKVGRYLVSTVGEYVPPAIHRSELGEVDWMKKNYPGEDIGLNRKYETMVFRAGKCCREPKCMCLLPSQKSSEIDFLPANTAGEAQKNHMALCLKWSRMQ